MVCNSQDYATRIVGIGPKIPSDDVVDIPVPVLINAVVVAGGG
jgi:hypothetical protein